MPRREFHRHRIFNLAIRKDAMKKTVSKSIDGTLNARALYKIDTYTDHAHLELSKRLATCLTRTVSPLPSQGRGQGEGCVHLAIRAVDPLTLILSPFQGEKRIQRAPILIRDNSPSRRAFLSRRFLVRPTSRARRWSGQYLIRSDTAPGRLAKCFCN